MHSHERIELSGVIADAHDLRFGLGLIGIFTALALHITLVQWFLDWRTGSDGMLEYCAAVIALCVSLYVLEAARSRPSLNSPVALIAFGATLVALLLIAASEVTAIFWLALACIYALIPSIWGGIRLRRRLRQINVQPFPRTFASWFRVYVWQRKPRAIWSAMYFLAEATLLWLGIIIVFWQLEIASATVETGTNAAGHASHIFLYVSGIMSFLVYRGSFSKFLVAASVDARDLIQYDRRPPVVLLREFGADAIHIRPRIPFLPRPDVRVRKTSVSGIPVEYTKVRLEQVIASELSRIGPMIAIGEPGEAAPRIGASRAYFSNDDWQKGIAEWIEAASVIIVLCGTSPLLDWEIDQISAGQLLSRTVFVVPPSNRRREICIRSALARVLKIPDTEVDIEHLSDMICFVVTAGKIRSYHTPQFHQLDYEFAIAAATRSLLETAT